MTLKPGDRVKLSAEGLKRFRYVRKSKDWRGTVEGVSSNGNFIDVKWDSKRRFETWNCMFLEIAKETEAEK